MTSQTVESKKLKIAFLSDSPFLPTGYSNQAKLLCRFLASKGHEIHYFANGYTGATLSHAKLEDGTEFPYKIYGQKSQYFSGEMSQLLKQIKADVFIILLDTFMLHGDPRNPQNGWFLKVDTSPAITFFWYPSDGGAGMPHGCHLILKKVEKAVAMAKFGQKQVKDYYKLDTDYIPHGTEPFKFFRMTDEEKLKNRMEFITYTCNNVGVQGDLVNKFIVGTVARNQARKFLDRMIKTAALLKDKIPNLILLFHSDPDDPAQTFDIREMARYYGVEHIVRFTGMSSFKGFPWNKMNNVYNLFDTFFLTTSGEGFGIPTIEAMSAEIPCLVTNYTTTEELVLNNQAGLGIKLTGTEDPSYFSMDAPSYDKEVLNGTILGSWDVERGIADVKDAAGKLLWLYHHPAERKQMGIKGREAVLRDYNFETTVGPAWEKLILEAIK